MSIFAASRTDLSSSTIETIGYSATGLTPIEEASPVTILIHPGIGELIYWYGDPNFLRDPYQIRHSHYRALTDA